MTWYYEQKEITTLPAEYAGFVYCITNNLNGRKYIGQKVSKNKITRPPLKGFKRKRVEYKESDWQDYYGSSEELKADISKYGKENFTREIIKLCGTKGELNYEELKEQVIRGVLESDEYYNGIIDCKIHKRHLKKT